MVCCAAYGCINRPDKKVPGITFHLFPKNEELRRLWIKAVRRSNWTPTRYSKLCSAHFHEDVIDRTSLCVVRLRENAVPTIFKAVSPYLEKKPDSEPILKKIKVTSVLNVEVNQLFVEEKSNYPLDQNKLNHPLDEDKLNHPLDEEKSKHPLDEDKLNQSPDSETVCHNSTLEISQTGNSNTSSSEEDNDFVDSTYNFCDSSCPDNDSKQLSSEEILKQKLEAMTALYEETRKKLKLCQKQCRFYAKQVIALEDVIDNLKMINSVTD